MKVRFKKLSPGAIIPTRATPQAAGLDLYSLDDVALRSGSTLVISTGVAMELPWGFEGQIRSRSGLSTKGVHVLNSPGTIDSDYRGELKVILHNSNSLLPHYIRAGDRIAQLVIAPVTLAEPEEVVELTGTLRDSGGLGSTGT